MITERQRLRRQGALELHAEYKARDIPIGDIGAFWNMLKDEAKRFGSSSEEAKETADSVMFRIPKSNAQTP